MRRDVFERASAVAVTRLRAADARHLRVYLTVAAAVAVLVCYLALSAQVTQTSYELARLQNRQAALQAEQGQLRLREADVHTPAQVERDARQSGLQRQPPRGFVTYQASAISLDAPIGDGARVERPRWQEAVAGILGAVNGPRDVLASDR